MKVVEKKWADKFSEVVGQAKNKATSPKKAKKKAAKATAAAAVEAVVEPSATKGKKRKQQTSGEQPSSTESRG